MQRHSRSRLNAASLCTVNTALAAILTGFISLGMAGQAGAADRQNPKGQILSFAVIGDLPYSGPDEDNLSAVLEDIDRSDVRLVIHLGDIKSGSEYCGDELLKRRLSLLNASRKPLILALGDNEWTDCHRRSAGGFKPEERLEFLREAVFAKPQSLGQQKLGFEQQGQGKDQPSENIAFVEQGVLFTVINVPGSNNNYWAQQSPEHPQNAEFYRRKMHNEIWIQRQAARAQKADIRAWVLAFQGNAFESDSREQRSQERDGYLELRNLLATELKAVQKPVLLVHGDTHSHRVDQVLKDDRDQTIKHVTRLEGFGFPFTRNWVQVRVKPAEPGAENKTLFEITARRLLAPIDSAP